MRFASVLALLAMLTTALPRVARADPPPADLMTRLAATSAQMEEVGKRASYTLDGRLETLDGDGKVSGVETRRARVNKDGKGQHGIIVRATKDGKDVTADEQKKATQRDAKSEEDKKKERIDLPFLAAIQPRYVFDQVETDAKDPTHVRITFTPREVDEHSVEGSAWVDTAAGQFLSAGFKVSKPGFLVDFVHVTIEVGAKTELGPAPSRITFDGKATFLFFHRHFRGSATLGEYSVAK